MGLEARCHGRFGLAEGEGNLRHEADKIVFRGPFRLDLAVKDLKKLSVAGDDLVIAWGRELATFSLGAALAARWVQKIRNPPGLLDKLGVKAGQQVALRGAFEAPFLKDLSARATVSASVQSGAVYDVILLLAVTPADLAAIRTSMPSLAPAGGLWVIYPKGGLSAIKESHVREAGLATGLVDNKTCAFSATLTALRWVRRRDER